MKLLPKQDISIAQAQKKRVEIDEGVKLARRIDSLREIIATEEASLEAFRVNTVKSIQADIAIIEEERNILKNEVKSLRDELEQGTKSLDIRQKELDERQKAFENKENKLLELISLSQLISQEVKKQADLSSSFYQRIVLSVDLTEDVRKDIAQKLDEASNYLQTIESRYHSFMDIKDQFEKELRSRDIDIASKERDLIIKEKHLDKTAEALHLRELQLIDREQTLEREFKRLKK